MINPPYYDTYVNNVTTKGLVESLELQLPEFHQFLLAINSEIWDYRYEENKWSLKEIIQHIIDTERIFCYRALRFARNDKTELPGFDENGYTPESNADKRSVESIINEFIIVRKATISLFETFDTNILQRTGIASDGKFDVEALGIIIAGHLYHHRNVIQDRYIKKAG